MKAVANDDLPQETGLLGIGDQHRFENPEQFSRSVVNWLVQRVGRMSSRGEGVLPGALLRAMFEPRLQDIYVGDFGDEWLGSRRAAGSSWT